MSCAIDLRQAQLTLIAWENALLKQVRLLATIDESDRFKLHAWKAFYEVLEHYTEAAQQVGRSL